MKTNTSSFQLVEGGLFELGNERCRVTRIKGQQVSLETDSKLLTLPVSELMSLYRQGMLKPAKPKKASISLILKLSPEQREEMYFKEEVVKEMLKQAPNAPTVEYNVISALKEVQKRYPDKDVKSIYHTTPARWLQRYRLYNKDPYMLINNPMRTQGKGKRYPVEVEELMFNVLCEEYLEKRKSIPATHKRLKAEMAEKLPQFTCPSQSSLYNKKDELDPDFVKLHREGPHAQSQDARQALKTFEVNGPFSRWEMDGKVIQVGILCPDTGEFLGIATIMLIIDCYTRVIPGYAIHVGKKKAETSELAVSCFKNAVLPNEDGTGFYGLPFLLAADAGSALVSRAFTHFLAMTGSNRVTTVTKRPQKKGFIERFNLTFERECLSEMPGFNGTLKLNERFVVQDNVEAAATLTLPECIALIDRYINDYNASEHSSLQGRSPAAVWEHYASPKSGLIRLPGDDTDEGNTSLQLFENFSGRCQEVTLQKNKGVVVEGRYYNCNELRDKFKPFIGKKKAMLAYYDHLDVSSVVVVAPDSNDFCIVPTTKSFVRAGMSKAEYELRLKQPYNDIPCANERHWTSGRDIIDGALARRASQELEKKRKAAEARKKAREKERQYMGLDVGDGNAIHDAIDETISANAPAENVVIDVDSYSESVDPVERETTTLPTGGVRGEF